MIRILHSKIHKYFVISIMKYYILWGCLWDKSSHLAFLRFFTPNPFSENQNWTFINVHF